MEQITCTIYQHTTYGEADYQLHIDGSRSVHGTPLPNPVPEFIATASRLEQQVYGHFDESGELIKITCNSQEWEIAT